MRALSSSPTLARRGDYLRPIGGPAITEKRFLLCPSAPTELLTCIFAITTGMVREPRSRWTKVGCQLDLFCSRPMSSFGCFVRELVGNLRFDTEKELSVLNEI